MIRNFEIQYEVQIIDTNLTDPSSKFQKLSLLNGPKTLGRFYFSYPSFFVWHQLQGQKIPLSTLTGNNSALLVYKRQREFLIFIFLVLKDSSIIQEPLNIQ